MADEMLGLLSGIGQGLVSGYSSYRQAKNDRQSNEYKLAELERQKENDKIKNQLEQAKLDAQKKALTPQQEMAKGLITKGYQPVYQNESDLFPSDVKKMAGYIEEKKPNEKGYQNYKNTYGPAAEIRREYQGRDVTKATAILDSAYQKIANASKSTSPQADMSLIFGFMKLQDPNSTVREGEYATAENTRGISDTVRNSYNKVIKGQKLTAEQRTGFLNEARNVYNAQLSKQKEIDDFYRNLAAKQNLDPTLILRDRKYELYEPGKIIKADGKTYRIVNEDGDMVEVSP